MATLTQVDYDPFAAEPTLTPVDYDPFAVQATEKPAERNIVKDTAVSFAGGANSLLEGLGTLYGLATGDMDNWAREAGESGRNYWDERKSDALKADEAERRAEIDAADGQWEKAGTAFWETIKNPALFASFASEQIPMFMPGGLAGRAGQAASLTTGVAGKTAKAASGIKLLKGIATVEGAAGAIGTGTAVATGAALQGADVGGDAYNEILSLPDTLWEINEEYQQLRAEVGDQKAKEEIALSLSRQAAAEGGAASVVTNLLPFGRVFERAASKSTAAISGGMMARGVKGGLGEMTQDASEEGLGRFSVNRAAQEIDQSRDLAQGVGEAAGLGAIGAAPFGIGAGMMSGSPQNTLPPEEAKRVIAAIEADLAKTAEQATADIGKATTADEAIDAFNKANDLSAELTDLSIDASSLLEDLNLGAQDAGLDANPPLVTPGIGEQASDLERSAGVDVLGQPAGLERNAGPALGSTGQASPAGMAGAEVDTLNAAQPEQVAQETRQKIGAESETITADVPGAQTVTAPSQGAASQNIQGQGSYRDGGEWSAAYATVKRTDGSFALERTLTDDQGARIEHMSQDGMWVKGKAARTTAMGSHAEDYAPLTFAGEQEANQFAAEDVVSMPGGALTHPKSNIEPTPTIQSETGLLVAKTATTVAETATQNKTGKMPVKPDAKLIASDLSQNIPKPGTNVPNLSIGTTPATAEPITVRDGVVYQGNYPAQHFETGEPITVPEGANRFAIAKALRDGGVLSNKQKIYGLNETQQAKAADIPQQATTKAVPAQEQAAQPKGQQFPSNSLIQRIKQLGGINNVYVKDVTGEGKNRVVGLFRKPEKDNSGSVKAGHGLDTLAGILASEGFDIDVNEVDGGVGKLAELVQEALTGRPVLNFAGQEEQSRIDGEARYRDDLKGEVAKMGGTFAKNISTEKLQALRDRLKNELDYKEKLAAVQLENVAGKEMTEADWDAMLDPDRANSFAATKEVDNGSEQGNQAEGQGNTGQDTGTEPGQGRATGGGESRTETAQGPIEGLTSYSNQDILAKEKQAEQAAAKAEREANKPTGPDVTADQVDLFNTQGGLFGSNREASTPPTQPQNVSKKAESGDTKPKKPSLALVKAVEKRAYLEDHFAPGNIIYGSYWKEHDQVDSFDWNEGNWNVTVHKVKKDSNGKWVAAGEKRNHSTFPDKKDRIEVRAEKPSLPTHQEVNQETTKPAESKPASEMTASELLRAAADKMDAEKTQAVDNKPAEVDKESPKVDKQAGNQKEPWQMTRREWEAAREAVRPNIVQSDHTKASASNATANARGLERLLYGVTDEASERLKAAQRGDIELSAEETDAITERLQTPVSHEDVVKKAVADGKPVPAEVLAEYPETKQTGTALYSRRIHGDRPTVNDYIVPETPEFDGNMSGDLAYTPQSAEEKGIEQLPIRLTVGVATGRHAGFGIEHIDAEARTDKRRMPPRYTADQAENYARHVAMLASNFNEVYTEGRHIILRSQRAKEALVVSRQTDRATGEDYYSVVSLRPAEKAVWGKPVWVGRTALPNDRLQQSSVPGLSPDQDSPRSDRLMLRNQTSHFDFTRQEADRQPKNKPKVDYKKRRTFTMDDVKKSRSGSNVATPHTVATLKAEIDRTQGIGFADRLEATGNFRIIADDDAAEILAAPGDAAFSRQTDSAKTRTEPSELSVEGFNSFEALPRDDGSITFVGTAKIKGQTYFANIKVTRREDGTPNIGLTDYWFETMTGKRVRGAANVQLEGLMDDAKEAAVAWAEANQYSPANPDIRYSQNGRILAFVKDGTVYMVADNIDQETDSVEGLLRHEIGVHALRLGRNDAEFQAILKEVDRLHQEGNARVKKARASVPTNTPADLITEETLGYLVEQSPQMTVSKRFMAWFRQAIRKLAGKLKGAERFKFFSWANKLTADDLALMADKALKTAPDTLGEASRDGEYMGEGLLAKLPGLAAKAWKSLTQHDEVFEYPRSNAADMEDIFLEVAPMVHIEKAGNVGEDMEQAWLIYPLDENGTPIKANRGYILEYKDGRVELNVLNYGKGKAGSAVYAAVGNYAYNNSKVFAGDRLGINDVGMERRLENMISLALKFGTTDHIALHPKQVEKLGIDWREGDFEHNLQQMVMASYDGIVARNPEIKDIIYDFDRHEFRNIRTGEVVSEQPRQQGKLGGMELVYRDGAPVIASSRESGSNIGSRTLKRAIFTNTVLRQESGEVPGDVLAALGRWDGGHVEPPFVGTLYSRRETRTAFAAYSDLAGESRGAEQAMADAVSITGLPAIETRENRELPDYVPMRLSLSDRVVEVNPNVSMSRAEAAQYMAEELLHAVDALASDITLSAGSKRLDPVTGDIALEAAQHYKDGGAYWLFLDYPFGDKEIAPDRVRAELFARLGVLYFGEPDLMRQALPLAYGAFDGIFQLRINPVTREVSRKIWGTPGGVAPLRRQQGASGRTAGGDAKSTGNRQSPELGRLRDAVSREFRASRIGRRVKLDALETKRQQEISGANTDISLAKNRGLLNAERAEDFDPSTEEAAKVQAGIEGKTPREAAKFIIDTGNEFQKEVAQKVLNQLNRLTMAGVKLDLKVAHAEEKVPGQLLIARGLTDWNFAKDNNRITVWINGADVTGKVGTSYEIVLHELVHMATSGLVHLGKLREASTYKTGKDVADLIAVTDHVRDHFNRRVADADAGRVELTDFENRIRQRANNALNDENEVLAWGLSNPDAQAYMESIPYPAHESAWGAFVSAIRRILGLPENSATAFTELLRVADNLMNDNVNEILGLDTSHGFNTAIQMPRGSGQQQEISGADTEQPKQLSTRIIGDSGRKYTPEQRAAMGRTGSIVTKRTPKEVLYSLRKVAAKRMAQGIFDQFRPVRELSDHAYALMRLSKGASGAFEALMHHGKLSLRDDAYDADTSGGVLETVFFPLGKETTDFLRWIAGNRAERLMAEGKENLFSKEDIAAFKSLSDGKTDFDYTLENGRVTRDRTLIYADSLKKFNEFNKNVLDMAEQSGLIDPDSRHLWEHEFYVPFYRAAEESDSGMRGMNIKSGVVRQIAFRKLKGGEQQLNDLLENTLMNWAHLIDASAKNRAGKAVFAAAIQQGAAHKTLPGDKNAVWVMHRGKKIEYTIDDPHLMEAISSLEYAGMRNPAMLAMSTMKHVLTVGVTASPFFKVRNLIRDSVQAIATSDLGYNPVANVAKGFKLTDRAAQEYVSALAGGGLIRFGTMLEGSEAKRTRQLIKKGAKDAHILDNENKIRAFYDTVLEPTIAAYNELGNRGEEINRMALYDRLIKKGVDHATASLMARDLMDFSMQGTWASVRFLTQVVPFMNARLQGLYKLGRAANEDKIRMATVLGGVTLASLALLAAYGDDDDWKEREDWDRDNYWWFKVGGVAYRIPKPFEIGAIATLAERSAELLFDSEMTGERFADVTGKLVFDQLAMNPVPQLFKPIIDVYANYDSFTGRPIETMGMERLAPEYRYNQSTSMVARGVSTAGNAMTGDNFLSPVQVDHVVRAYFGWLGSFVVGGADMMVRDASDEPTRPALDYWKTATGGMVADLDGARSRYVSQMYDQARELEEAYGTWRHLLKEGKVDEAREFRTENAEDLRKYRRVSMVKRQITAINERIRRIERSDMSREEKRTAINALRQRQGEIAERLN